MRWYVSLRRSGEIAYVRRNGRHAGVETLSLYANAAPSGPPRVAVTVSKAVGGAVVRNRVKRRIKGALDALPPPASPLRLVIVARPQAASQPYERLAGSLAAGLARLRITA